MATTPSPFTANRALGLLFSVAMAIAVAFGAWVGLYFVTNKDYDFKFREFSEDVGLVAGDYIRKSVEKVQQGVSSAGSTLSAVSSLGSMLKKGPAGLAKGVVGSAGDAAAAAATGAAGKVPGLGALAPLVPKA
jgi:hypothetical protein